MKKAFILDLDNTIYPVPSIGNRLFKPVFDAIGNSGLHDDDMEEIKRDMMRIPFQVVAEKYKMNKELQDKCMSILKEIEHEGPINSFEDFEVVRRQKVDLFLVTTGFMKMQQSKASALELDKYFKEIFIVDPTNDDRKKKDIFEEIISKYNYAVDEVLVIGDDPDSEIMGGHELGLDTVLYDRDNRGEKSVATYTISSYHQLQDIIDGDRSA